MIEYFPKINYDFGGITLSVTNIFKSVKLEIDTPDTVLTYTLSGQRPDVLANTLYNNSNLFWSFFLTNNIKNPLTEWGQIQSSYTDRINAEYDGWEYQFANTSQFIPGNTFNFNSTTTNPYDGIDFSGLSAGDLIVYETGTGPHSIVCYGSGGITSTSSCCSPQYGQSIIPDNFNDQSSIIQTSCGDYFTACLTKTGSVYVWGNFAPSSGFSKTNNLWKSDNSGYSYIDANGGTLILIKDNTATCFGDCTKFNDYSAGSFALTKIAWTSNGLCGGVGINTNGSTRHFGWTASGDMGATYNNIACGSNFCAGIKTLDNTAVVWGAGFTASFCTSGVVQGGVNVSGFTCDTLAAGKTHVVLKKHGDGLTAWGGNTYGQCNVSSFPSDIIAISAGEKHTGILYEDRVEFSGVFSKYNQSSGCNGVQEDQSLTPITGSYSSISSGNDHVILQQFGNSNKYIGIIDSIDNLYKRIFVRSYQFSDTIPLYLDDPSGTIVSFWRWSGTPTPRYNLIKNINHQLLSIQKYIDSTLYVNTSGSILNPTVLADWLSIYLSGYQNALGNTNFITLKKQLLDVEYKNRLNVSYISGENTRLLKQKIMKDVLTSDDLIIKTSEL